MEQLEQNTAATDIDYASPMMLNITRREISSIKGMMNLSEQYVKQFNVDLGELSLSLVGESHWRKYNPSKIASIQNTLGKKKVLFMEKPVERIEILVSGEPQPYVIQRGVIEDDFLWIKDVLKSYAEKNKVSYAE